jgi:hypothetical protein
VGDGLRICSDSAKWWLDPLAFEHKYALCAPGKDSKDMCVAREGLGHSGDEEVMSDVVWNIIPA